jgi:hypothetical protein
VVFDGILKSKLDWGRRDLDEVRNWSVEVSYCCDFSALLLFSELKGRFGSLKHAVSFKCLWEGLGLSGRI